MPAPLRKAICLLALLAATLLPAVAAPAAAQGIRDRWFTTSDGVRLHYLEAGQGRTIVLVPGWTMPGWIFGPQIAAFSTSYHVVAFDPRGQGDSEVAPSGYDAERRGRDIAELIARLGPAPVLLVGWSLGVLDSLAYIGESGDGRLAGLVLIDNSVGEEPAPVPSRRRVPYRAPLSRDAAMARFVRSMFRRPQNAAYLDRLTEDCLRTPPAAAAALLAYSLPRTYWKEVLYSVRRPVLYVVRPHLAGQAANVALHDPYAETAVFRDAGHALFIDDASRFNALLASFIRQRVFP